MSGWAALQAAGPEAIEAFIRAHDVDHECRHGLVPATGPCPDCAAEAGRPMTPDLMRVLPRVPARRVLRAVAEGDPAPVEGGVDRVAA